MPNLLYEIFAVNITAVQLNINNVLTSVYIDYDGDHVSVSKNSGIVFCKKTGVVKLLHVCSSVNNTTNMNVLLREEDVVVINGTTNYQIVGNVLKVNI